jgi:hypothetical protein
MVRGVNHVVLHAVGTWIAYRVRHDVLVAKVISQPLRVPRDQADDRGRSFVEIEPCISLAHHPVKYSGMRRKRVTSSVAWPKAADGLMGVEEDPLLHLALLGPRKELLESGEALDGRPGELCRVLIEQREARPIDRDVSTGE